MMVASRTAGRGPLPPAVPVRVAPPSGLVARRGLVTINLLDLLWNTGIPNALATQFMRHLHFYYPKPPCNVNHRYPLTYCVSNDEAKIRGCVIRFDGFSMPQPDVALSIASNAVGGDAASGLRGTPATRRELSVSLASRKLG